VPDSMRIETAKDWLIETFIFHRGFKSPPSILFPSCRHSHSSDCLTRWLKRDSAALSIRDVFLHDLALKSALFRTIYPNPLLTFRVDTDRCFRIGSLPFRGDSDQADQPIRSLVGMARPTMAHEEYPLKRKRMSHTLSAGPN
jgi:hypothetical protein